MHGSRRKKPGLKTPFAKRLILQKENYVAQKAGFTLRWMPTARGKKVSTMCGRKLRLKPYWEMMLTGFASTTTLAKMAIGTRAAMGMKTLLQRPFCAC